MADRVLRDHEFFHRFKIGDIWFEATIDRVSGMIMWKISGRPTPSVMIVDAVRAAMGVSDG